MKVQVEKTPYTDNVVLSVEQQGANWIVKLEIAMYKFTSETSTSEDWQLGVFDICTYLRVVRNRISNKDSKLYRLLQPYCDHRELYEKFCKSNPEWDAMNFTETAF